MIMSQSIERDIPLRTTNNQNITTNASNSNTTMIDRDTSSDSIAKCDTNINSTLSLDGHCKERGPPSLCEGAPSQFTLGTATSTTVNTPSTTLETNATTNVTATTTHSAKFRKAKSTTQSLSNRANYKRLPLQSNREYTTVTTDEEVECGSSSSSSEDSDDIEDGEEVEERSGEDELDFSEDDLSQEEDEGSIECDEGVEPSHDCHAAALERHCRYMYFQDSDSSASDEEDNTNDIVDTDDDDSQEDLSEEEMISSDEEESDVEPLEEDDEQEVESDDDDEESIDASCYYDQQHQLEEEEEEDFYTDYDQYDYNDDDELMENYHGTPPHQHPHFSSNSFQLHDLYLPRGMETEYELLKYDSDEDSSCSSSNEEDEESGEYVGVNQAFPHRRYMIQRGGGYGYRPRMWDGSSSSSSLSRQRQSNAIVERTISPSTINSSDEEEEQTDQVTTSSTTTTKTSVTFNTKVTIHPIYETKPPIYPPQILDQIYTNRDELRLNKLRNKKEYAYDNHDWRLCTEEEGMEVDLITGECVHPVHGESESSGSGSIVGSGSRVPIVQTYSSAWGGYRHSSCNDDDEGDEEEENTASNLSCSSSNRVIVHRAKRMRMYYP